MQYGPAYALMNGMRTIRALKPLWSALYFALIMAVGMAYYSTVMIGLVWGFIELLPS